MQGDSGPFCLICRSFYSAALLFGSSEFLGMGFPGGTMVKNLLGSIGDARDEGLNPGSGRSYGGGNSNPLQYSCLGNPTDRGAWRAAVHGVAQSDTTEHT